MKQKMKERASKRPCFVVPFRTMVMMALAGMGIILGACEPSELRPVPALPSGGSQPAPRAPTAPDQPMAPPAMGYTEDPEAETEEWEDYVWADDAAQAQRKCEQLAATYTQQGGSAVTVVRVTRGRQRGSRWICTFKG